MLEPLLTPQTVTVVGASRTPGKVGHDLLANLKEGGFQGEIVPVNPSADEILGLRCCKDLRAYDGAVDLSVILVPAPAVRSAVESSIQAGAKAVVVVSAGFREVGEDGAELEREVAQICKVHGVRLLGPNCLGLINTHHRMNASFAPHMPTPGVISVISQSGALCAAILDWAADRHLGLAKVVSIGNKTDIDEADLLAALADDSDTAVIVAYLESIASGSKFIRAAEAAASTKPVVVLKAGTTPAGLKAASSHTGSSSQATYSACGAVLKRSGVIEADDFESLLDIASALALQPLPAGGRVAIITNAGGPGVLAADAVENAGMTVVPLAKPLVTGLGQRLLSRANVASPIHMLGDADPDRYAAVLTAAQEDDSVHAIIVILTPQVMTQPAETAQGIAACVRAGTQQPVLASFMAGGGATGIGDELRRACVPSYGSPERAVAALRAMWAYATWRRHPPRVVTRFPVNDRRVERIISRHARTGETNVGELETKEILRAYRFTVPDGFLATTAEEAVEVAERLGFPVAIKIVSPEVIRKSDVGGVRLNLFDRDAVLDAYDVMMMRVRRKVPWAHVQGVHVEKMGTQGRGVIISMVRDPNFGPMLMFSLGGPFAEAMKDMRPHLAPITEEEAMQMLVGTRSSALSKGAGGLSRAGLKAVATCLQRISQLSTDFPQIAELDISPLVVADRGMEPFVAGARMSLCEAALDPTTIGSPVLS